ncbi:C69 family dipeptidase [Lactobacillus delbrueckii subsp. bulgaricus]
MARDEDYDQGFNEKRFVYYPAKNYDELFVSKGTGVEIPLKGEGCGFTAVRDAVEDYGRFDEQGDQQLQRGHEFNGKRSQQPPGL